MTMADTPSKEDAPPRSVAARAFYEMNRLLTKYGPEYMAVAAVEECNQPANEYSPTACAGTRRGFKERMEKSK